MASRKVAAAVLKNSLKSIARSEVALTKSKTSARPSSAGSKAMFLPKKRHAN